VVGRAYPNLSSADPEVALKVPEAAYEVLGHNFLGQSLKVAYVAAFGVHEAAW